MWNQYLINFLSEQNGKANGGMSEICAWEVEYNSGCCCYGWGANLHGCHQRGTTDGSSASYCFIMQSFTMSTYLDMLKIMLLTIHKNTSGFCRSSWMKKHYFISGVTSSSIEPGVVGLLMIDASSLTQV